jgi:hypothetical protein
MHGLTARTLLFWLWLSRAPNHDGCALVQDMLPVASLVQQRFLALTRTCSKQMPTMCW